MAFSTLQIYFSFSCVFFADIAFKIYKFNWPPKFSCLDKTILMFLNSPFEIISGTYIEFAVFFTM